METQTTIDVILWKRRKTDHKGTVTLQVTKGTGSSYERIYQSLKCKIDSKYWNEKKQRVRAVEGVDYKTINSEIDRKLAELASVGTHQNVRDNRRDYLEYCDDVIDKLPAYGTRVKYTTIIKKLRKFLATRKNRSTLPFSDLTPELVRELHTYLLREMSRTSANNYLKVYQRFVKTAVQERIHHYEVSPFVSVEFKGEKKVRSSLSEIEIDRFRHAEVPTHLRHAQQAFIAQLLAQGMRVSDLMLLRWADIGTSYITYTMFKTGKSMSVYINEPLLTIIVQQAQRYPVFKKLSPQQEQLALKRAKAATQFDSAVSEDAHDGKVVPKQEQIRKALRLKLRFTLLDLAKSKYAKDLVFPFLRWADFPERVSRETISEKQYKELHKAEVSYNRHLKEIQEQAGIRFNITSHAARHAFTNLLRTDQVRHNLYDISRALGHSSLKTTESYLATFDEDRVTQINQGVAQRLG